MAGPTLSSLAQAFQTNTDPNAKNSISLEINSLIESFVLTYQGPTQSGSSGSQPEVSTSAPQPSAPATTPEPPAPEPSASTADTPGGSQLPASPASTQAVQPSTQVPPAAPTSPSPASPAQPAQPDVGTSELSSASTSAPLTPILNTGTSTISLPTGLLPHVESDLSSTGSYAARASSFLGDKAVESLTSEWGTATDQASKQDIASELDNMYSIFISFAPATASPASDAGAGVSTETDYSFPSATFSGAAAGTETPATPDPPASGPDPNAGHASIFSDPRMLSLSRLFMTATDSQVQQSALSAINGLYSTLNGQYQTSVDESEPTEAATATASSDATSAAVPPVQTSTLDSTAAGPSEPTDVPNTTGSTAAPNATDPPAAPGASDPATGEQTSGLAVASTSEATQAATPTGTVQATTVESVTASVTETATEPATSVEVQSTAPVTTQAVQASTDGWPSTGQSPPFTNGSATYANGTATFANGTATATNGTAATSEQPSVALEPGNGGAGSSSANPSAPTLSNKAYKIASKIEAGILAVGIFLLL